MKKILITLFLYFGVLYVYSQNTNLPDVTPDNPQSQHFDNYINHSITEYNGLPNISIPLYEINLKGLKIPITLSYHASGIKHLQYDGDIGAGWSINAGGYRISRTIQGRLDEKYKMYDKNKADALFPGQGHGFGPPGDVEFFLAELATEDNNLSINKTDGEYDLFSYSTPGTNGNFIILDRNSTNSVAIMERNNDKIIIDGGGKTLSLTSMEVTDDNGFSYSFGGAYIDMMMVTPAAGNKSGWPMYRIDSPDKTTYASFNYTKYNVDYNPSKDKTGRNGMSYSDPILAKPWVKGNNYADTDTTNFYTRTYIDKGFYGPNYDYANGNKSYFINQINTDKEVIKFIRKGSNTTGSWQDYMITEVRIEDKNGALIKSYSFDYQFIKYQYTTAGSGNTTQYNDRRWHYLLKSLTVKNASNSEKKYQMEYYDAPQETGKTLNSVAADQWGYYQKCGYPDQSGVTLHWAFNSDSIQHKYTLPRERVLGVIPTLKFNGAEFRTLTAITHAAYRDRVAETPNYFSLKKLIYPAGGYTEYEYESNQYIDGEETVKGAGLRIAKIKSQPGNYVTLPVTTMFKYGHNEDGNGIANIKLNEGHFASTSCSFSLGVAKDNYGIEVASMSMRPTTSYFVDPCIPDLPSVHVHYDKVIIYEYDENSKKNNGRTELIYKIPQQYEERVFNSNLIISNYSFNGFIYKQYRDFNPKNYGRSYIANYYLGYTPVPLFRRVYNDKDQLLQSEEYTYLSTPDITYKGIKARQRIFFDHYYWQPSNLENGKYKDHLYMFNHVNYLFDTNDYYLHAGRDLLSSKTSTAYTENGAVATKETYEYNDKFQIKKVSRTDSEDETVITHFKYPQDYGNTDPYSTMVSKNMLSPIIEEYTTKGVSNEKISIKKNEYSIIGGSRIYLFASWVSSSQDDGLRKVLTYDSYDLKGNLTEYTAIDNLKTAIFWGYGYQYPVIEVKNASYEEVKNTLLSINANLTIANIGGSMNPDMALINQLRIKLPGVMVTTYTYKPLVGVLSITNPLGIVTYFNYDEFNRLKESYIMEGTTKKVIQEYKYNYQNK